MGLDESIYPGKDPKNKERVPQDRAIILHAFSDVSRVSPAVFVYLLKECYLMGTHKATLKFQILQKQVSLALQNGPQPGPATFVVKCLYIVPLLGPPYAEGFSHLLMLSLRRLDILQKTSADSCEAKSVAARLFLDTRACLVIHEERILIKILEDFDIGLEDIRKVICGSEEHDRGAEIAKACLEQYILGIIESQSYMTAVFLLERFSIRHFGESFLVKMLQNNQFKAAEKWAVFMGKPMLFLLVQKYLDMKMLKNAIEIIKKNNLKAEFPDVYHLYKESSLKQLAEKGCWDIAEIRTNNDPQLVEYLVYLAMEAGYTEKVVELCDKYSLKGFPEVTAPEANISQTCYLHLNELVSEDVIWVDKVDELLGVTTHIDEYKVVGIDCEWRPNYEKGGKQNKVSILQLASENKVFIFDMIKLFEDCPNILDSCLKRVLHSRSILKLGYNMQCDLQQLSHSYGNLECFQNYEMLLDIQKLFKERNGGLSALAKKILGAGLNKTRRNSNWEQRPLTPNQIEYAALDAAVLVHIFHHVCGQSENAAIKEMQAKLEWKSHIVSYMGKTKVPKKQRDVGFCYSGVLTTR